MIKDLKVTLYVCNDNPDSDYYGKTMGFDLPMADEEIERSVKIIGDLTAKNIKSAILGCYSDNKYDFAKGFGDINTLYEMNDIITEINETYEYRYVLAYSEASGYDLKESIERYEDYSRWYGSLNYKDLVEEEMSECLDIGAEFLSMLFRHLDHESFAKDEMCVLETKNGKIVLY